MKNKIAVLTAVTTLCLSALHVAAAPSSHAVQVPRDVLSDSDFNWRLLQGKIGGEDSDRAVAIIGGVVGLSAAAAIGTGVAVALSSPPEAAVPPAEPNPDPTPAPAPDLSPAAVDGVQPVQQAPAPVADAPRQQIASVPSGATELAPGIARYI